MFKTLFGRFVFVTGLVSLFFTGCDTTVRSLNEDNSTIITGFPSDLLASLELQNNIDINNDGQLSEKEAANVASLDLSSYVCGWVDSSGAVLTDSDGLAVTEDDGITAGYSASDSEYTWTNELDWLDMLSYFTNITSLTIGSSSNPCALESIDLSECTSLETLSLSYTDLTSLDLTGLSSLTSLTLAFSSKIPSVDLTICPSLSSLDVRGCAITSGLEEISSLSSLTELKIHRLGDNNNAMMGKTDGTNYDVTTDDFPNNNTVSFDSSTFTDKTGLTEIMLEDCGISSLDVSNCSVLKNIYLEGNSLSGTLDLTGISTGLKNIQVTGNPDLTEIILPGSKTPTSAVYADTGVTCTNADGTATYVATTTWTEGSTLSASYCTTTWTAE